MTNENLELIKKEKFQAEKLHYVFKNVDLLVQAFTRKSFSAEHQGWEDNENLEFVGDKVLDYVVVQWICRAYSGKRQVLAQMFESIENGESPCKENLFVKTNFEFTYDQGEMTELKKQIVQTRYLARCIENAELEKYLIMGEGDIKNNVQNMPHVKEDLCEAIIGAVAIDSSWDMQSIELVVCKLLNLTDVVNNGVDDGTDYISLVQAWHHKEYGKDPEYKMLHDDRYEYFCSYLKLPGNPTLFDGYGTSQKAACRDAAKRLYKKYISVQEERLNVLCEIGSFDLDTAIGKLQELQDKKIISGLDFLYREEAPTAETNGNPVWYCQCKVDGVEDFVEYGDVKKAKAKKAAAYTMLEILTTGRDKILEKILEKENERKRIFKR